MGKMIEFAPQEIKNKVSVIHTSKALFGENLSNQVAFQPAVKYLDNADACLAGYLDGVDIGDVAFAANKETALHAARAAGMPNGDYILYYGATGKEQNYIACVHTYPDKGSSCSLYRVSGKENVEVYIFALGEWSSSGNFKVTARLAAEGSPEGELARALSKHAGLFLLEMNPDMVVKTLEENKLLIELRKRTWAYSRYCVAGDPGSPVVGIASANSRVHGCMAWIAEKDGVPSYCLGQVLPANDVTSNAGYHTVISRENGAGGDVLVPIWQTEDVAEITDMVRDMWDHYPRKRDILQIPVSRRLYAESADASNRKYIIHGRGGKQEMTEEENSVFRFAVRALTEDAGSNAADRPKP